MTDCLHPDEQQDFADAQAWAAEACVHCHFMSILWGPASAPYSRDDPNAVASLFCCLNPPASVPTANGVIGVFPPVRPGGWCGRFEQRRTRMLKGAER